MLSISPEVRFPSRMIRPMYISAGRPSLPNAKSGVEYRTIQIVSDLSSAAHVRGGGGGEGVVIGGNGGVSLQMRVTHLSVYLTIA